MPLIPSVWIPYFIGDSDQFFNDDTFLADGVSQQQYVNNDEINFTYKGTDMDEDDIVEDFTTDGTSELGIHMREDVPDKIAMTSFSTKQIVIPSDDMLLLPYDKKTSLFNNARAALKRRIAMKGIHLIAPVNSAKTPVILIPTGNTNGTDGYKLVTRTDFITLRKLLDKKYPGKNKSTWKAMVSTDVYWDLIANDSILAAQYGQQIKPGDILTSPVLNIANIMIYVDDRTAWYTDANTKLAYGSTPTPGTHLPSIQVYFPKETFINGLGATEFFSQEKHPGKQADLASFRTRAYVGPWGQTAGNFQHAGAILRRPNN
jgi:hypothetical protein